MTSTFREIYQYTDKALWEYPERQLEVMGKAKLALEELEIYEAVKFEPLPVLVFALRDMVAWITFELDPAVFIKKYGQTSTISELCAKAIMQLKDIGVETNRQPDWKEEAYRLYKSVMELGGDDSNLNPIAKEYLHRKYFHRKYVNENVNET